MTSDGLVARVRAELAGGATADAVARRLGMPTPLVQDVLDRLAAAGALRCGPSGCPPTASDPPVTCAGCQLLGSAR